MTQLSSAANTVACRDILSEWNRVPQLKIRSSDLQWNLTEQNLVEYREAKLAGVDVLLAVATPMGVTAGLLAQGLWLSLWRNIPEGQEAQFVQDLLSLAKSWAKSNVTVGGDEFHFVPGVPLDHPSSAGLLAALQAANFKGSEVVDLVGDLGSAAVANYIDEASALARERNLQMLAASPEDLDGLESFLGKEYPGRWSREFKFWRSRSDTKKAQWHLLQDSQKTLLGFARIALAGQSISGWNPGALRLPLANQYQQTDSCLGPIGLAASEQGKGLGRVLLGLTLRQVRELGGQKICIDWTNALRFYAPLGFNLRNRYWSGRHSGL
jgi:GNAT superfamily N-acetyltransferase